MTTPAPTMTAAASPVSTPAVGQGATVARVIDGDTVELDNGDRVRYVGLNTPEEGQPFYQEAKEANRQLVEGRRVLLEFDISPIDTYGRWLAYVFVDGRFVNYELLRGGFANAYTVPPNVKYEELFRQGERRARADEAGLWASVASGLKIAHVEADAPGSDSDNPNGEWVEIINEGSSLIHLDGYTLADEANHMYVFGSFRLASGNAVRLYTGQGQGTPQELYWGLRDQSVWNNGGDTAYLRDAQGNLLDVYGY